MIKMKKEEFLEHLDKRPELFEWREETLQDKEGVLVHNKQFETTTHFTWDAIQRNELPSLLEKTHHGKNLEHITRVTGFFSKVQSWNKGKTAELKDRHRDRQFNTTSGD